MGIPVLILGESGSGKSTSLRNFEPDEVGVFNVAGKPLPFRKQLKTVDTNDYNKIYAALQNGSLKTYVIDDSQYLMAFEMFARAKETGFAKFTDIAVNFHSLLQFIINGLSKDTIVYFMQHTDQTDTGKIKAKTCGKMIDNQLTLEGLFSIVLMAQTDGKRHYFVTQSDGHTTCKSPMDMFEPEIDNDLKFVDKTIREYWNLNKNKKGEDEQ
ncbi:MAG: AAA family ATPase [Clostridia bacterium]|nr:AAA family ATPase [Clostridia bacterium]